MKKTIISILLLITVFFIGHNVYAEDPTEYTAGDYKYIIDKYAIRVYQIDNDEDGQTSNNTFSDFQANRFIREVDIPAEDITSTPAATEKTIDAIKAQVVNLNAVVSEEKLKALLADEMNAATETKNYICEIVVYYKVTEAPEKFQKFYTVNFYKELMKQFVSAFGLDDEYSFESNVKEVSLNTEVAQPIQYVTIKNDSFDNYTTAEATEPPSLLFNYFQFSENGYSEEEEPTDILMLTNVSDVDYLVGVISELLSDDGDYYDEDDVDEINIPTGYTVKVEGEPVPDTAMNKNTITIIVGLIMVLSGIGVAFRTVIKNN